MNSMRVKWMLANGTPHHQAGVRGLGTQRMPFQKDGKLVLQMTHEPHTRKNCPPLFYMSGILRSKMQRTYGCYEVRMKGFSLFPGACPAWHLPMNLTLSLGLRHPHIGWVGMDMKPQPNAATAEGFPTAMEVDYVRVWERKP